MYRCSTHWTFPPHSNHPTFRSFPCFFYHRSRANYGAESGLQGSQICTCHSTYAVAHDVLIQRPTRWVGLGFSIVGAAAIVAAPAREKLKLSKEMENMQTNADVVETLSVYNESRLTIWTLMWAGFWTGVVVCGFALLLR